MPERLERDGVAGGREKLGGPGNLMQWNCGPGSDNEHRRAS